MGGVLVSGASKVYTRRGRGRMHAVQQILIENNGESTKKGLRL